MIRNGWQVGNDQIQRDNKKWYAEWSDLYKGETSQLERWDITMGVLMMIKKEYKFGPNVRQESDILGRKSDKVGQKSEQRLDGSRNEDRTRSEWM